MLDVAGLVPGASKGQGLGNQFLNDLRAARVLIHVVDVSGTTDEGGKATTGYNPINDVDWLKSEIREWVLTNIKNHWSAAVRKNVAGGMALDRVFSRLVSGYGANLRLCTRVISLLDSEVVKKSLDTWSNEDIEHLVDIFLSERFPMIIVSLTLFLIISQA